MPGLGLGLEALGWAFAAFDAGGNVVAAAYGVPPRDADTIQGAELWALKQALTFVPFPVVEFAVASNGYIRPKGGTTSTGVSIYHALDAGELADSRVHCVVSDV